MEFLLKNQSLVVWSGLFCCNMAKFLFYKVWYWVEKDTLLSQLS